MTYQRPTDSPCLNCDRDVTCPHPCQTFREWFHDRWPGPKAETFGIVAPDEDFKICRWCRKPIATRGKYCSDACRLEAKRAKNRDWMRETRRAIQ